MSNENLSKSHHFLTNSFFYGKIVFVLLKGNSNGKKKKLSLGKWLYSANFDTTKTKKKTSQSICCFIRVIGRCGCVGWRTIVVIPQQWGYWKIKLINTSDRPKGHIKS